MNLIEKVTHAEFFTKYIFVISTVFNFDIFNSFIEIYVEFLGSLSVYYNLKNWNEKYAVKKML